MSRVTPLPQFRNEKAHGALYSMVQGGTHGQITLQMYEAAVIVWSAVKHIIHESAGVSTGPGTQGQGAGLYYTLTPYPSKTMLVAAWERVNLLLAHRVPRTEVALERNSQ
jgi:hypothetical protein